MSVALSILDSMLIVVWSETAGSQELYVAVDD
jgi:hypothetical protein